MRRGYKNVDQQNDHKPEPARGEHIKRGTRMKDTFLGGCNPPAGSEPRLFDQIRQTAPTRTRIARPGLIAPRAPVPSGACIVAQPINSDSVVETASIDSPVLVPPLLRRPFAGDVCSFPPPVQVSEGSERQAVIMPGRFSAGVRPSSSPGHSVRQAMVVAETRVGPSRRRRSGFRLQASAFGGRGWPGAGRPTQTVLSLLRIEENSHRSPASE